MASTAAPGTSIGGGGGQMYGIRATPEGQFTSFIYGHIRDENYEEAVRILTMELQNFPRSRAALSLLGYCYYQVQDFRSAAQCYEELCRYHPEVDSYRVYYAQCLYKAGLYPEATKACQRVDSEQYSQRLLQLQAAIAYEEDDLSRSRSLLDACVVPDDPDTLVNHACIIFKEGKYEEARAKFAEAMAALGYAADLAYNTALCYYCMKAYDNALLHIQEIIERGVREHPELSVGSGGGSGLSNHNHHHGGGGGGSNGNGSASHGAGGGGGGHAGHIADIRSVGNTQTLRETALVEAFNLKAAIEFTRKNMEGAREALNDMPPRDEGELDPVTLHNAALASMDTDPTGGFRKLNFLLTNPPFPAETFGNLLLLYLKHGCFDLAADVMAENTHLTFRLTPELYDFLDASIMTATSPEEAYRKYDFLTARYIETLRKHTKAVQDARLSRDNEATKNGLKLYDETLQRYIPVLMGMARIYWDRDNYTQVEKIFRQAAEFASENDVWKLNVAHVFMQQGKYAEAIRLYEPIVKKAWEKLTDVTAIVLANLCVAYIMTGQNNMAEITMKKIEEEEQEQAKIQAEKVGLKVGPNGVILGGGSSGSGGGLGGAGRDGGGAGGAANVPGGAGGSSGSTTLNASHAGIKPAFHLCIVNLVIGTLYCTEGNYDFGVSRVIESLVPYEKKLGVDTWYYAKRCFVAFAEGIAKGMITAQDDTFVKILAFLDAAERLGAKINTTVGVTTTTGAVGGGSSGGGSSSGSAFSSNNHYNNNKGAGGSAKDGDILDSASHTVRYEARMLKRMYMKLRDC